MAEYDKYCHYVAGLVGIGLSQLFGERAGAVLTFLTQQSDLG